MKSRIGLYLSEFGAGSGGMFQYGLSVLAAVAALPEDEFEVQVIYSHRDWEAYVNAAGVESRYVRLGLFGRQLPRALRVLRTPLAWQRALLGRLHPLARALAGQESRHGSRSHIGNACDLWIFPTQDHWAYQLPVPALGAVHDLMHRYEPQFPELGSRRERRRRDYRFGNLCRWGLGLLVSSEVVTQQLVESYQVQAAKIHLLPYVPPAYIFAESPPGFAQRYPGLPKEYFFYPAQFWQHKNHRNLLLALARLKPQYPDLNLVFAGSQRNAYAEIVKLVAEHELHEQVKFLGYVPDADLRALYQGARALLMPTLIGPTDLPPLEAFAAGCPVAISAIYGRQDWLGDAAVFFDPNDCADIAACMQRLWRDDELCAQLRQRGAEFLARWGPEQFAQRLATIIKQVISTRNEHPS